MTLFVVRHAHAGERSTWEGDDQQRPLSVRGRTQADGIAAALAGREPKRILTSPALRCVQTVEPLAALLGRPVEVEQRLQEGTSPDRSESLLDELADTDAVLCSHGDIIPDLLHSLVRGGMEPARNLVWQKASTWTVERVDGHWGAGHYTAPPDRAPA